MKISTKTLIGTILAVLIAVLALTVGAAMLNISQTEENNKNRLKIALEEVQQLLLKPVIAIEEKHHHFVETSPKLMPYYTKILTLDSLKEVKIEIELSDFFTQPMILYGKTLETHFGFFSALGTDSGAPELKFQFILEQGGLVIEKFVVTPGKYGLDTKTLKGGPIPFPQINDFPGSSSIQLINGQLVSVLKLPLAYQGDQPSNNINPGDLLGYFIMLKPFDIDFERLVRNLGVRINIYDLNGVLVQGDASFGNIDLEGIPSTQDVVDLQTDAGEKYDSILSPIIHNEKISGYLSVAISQKTTQDKTFQIIYLLSGIALVIIILVGIATFIFVNRLLRPLQKVTLLLKNIADGEGDLTQRLQFSGQDEIGQLSQWFNLFVEKLQALIEQIQIDSTSLATAFEELSRHASEIKNSSSNISDSITSESTAITQSSSTITQMVQSLQSMFADIKEIQHEANQSEETAIHGVEVIRNLDEKITLIETSSKKIESVVDVISSITSQTDLLSLNAAIEAAKGGEHGKGFAVVAEEIRVLSTKSHVSTAEIAKLIEASGVSVQEGLEVVEQTKKLLVSITEQVREITGSMNNLSGEMNDQEYRIKEIAKTIDEISNLSENNATSIMQLSHTIDESDSTTHNLSHLSESLMSKVNRFKIK